ncbi:MAG: hypothetical protein NDF54_06860 [archaeon GB-1867-035]|nr:hypothetical protein [Candidatus Culexmicrobium profundum]
MQITYTRLLNHLKRGVRNGNWRRRLDHIERAFYRAALAYSKIKGKIVNSTVIRGLLQIIRKLRETPLLRILKAGLNRAQTMRENFIANGVFNWCPQAKKWLSNPAYIMWLGLTEGVYILSPTPTP